jgi:hypothetical protein
MDYKMIRWRILFVFVSCLFIWCNEWSKINCNYQIYLRTFYANWDTLSTDERLDIKKRDEEKLPFSFFHTHSDFEWMYTKSLYFWTTMKWIIPCFFTLAFASTGPKAHLDRLLLFGAHAFGCFGLFYFKIHLF